VPSQATSQECVWLQSRPQEAAILCPLGSGSDARTVCPETCGVCKDSCTDDATGSFLVSGISRNCQWLNLRPALLTQECRLGKDAWTYCRETCGNCIPFPTIAPSKSRSPLVTPTPSPTVALVPATPQPSNAKNKYDTCDDNRFGTFFVSETNQGEPCRWLWSRPEMKLIYCSASHPSGAYNVCEETCGKCSDTCEDDNTISFTAAGKPGKNCAYIAVRNNLIDTMCIEGADAYVLCRETCNSCLPP
jgi:hypothetical protein